MSSVIEEDVWGFEEFLEKRFKIKSSLPKTIIIKIEEYAKYVNRRNNRKKGFVKSLKNKGQRYCGYCGIDTNDESSKATADHIIPLSRGGTDNENNVVLSCLSCNKQKRTFLWLQKYDPVTGKLYEHIEHPTMHPSLRDGRNNLVH